MGRKGFGRERERTRRALILRSPPRFRTAQVEIDRGRASRRRRAGDQNSVLDGARCGLAGACRHPSRRPQERPPQDEAETVLAIAFTAGEPARSPKIIQFFRLGLTAVVAAALPVVTMVFHASAPRTTSCM